MKNAKSLLTLVFFATIFSLFMSSCSKGGEATPEFPTTVQGKFVVQNEGTFLTIGEFKNGIAEFTLDESYPVYHAKGTVEALKEGKLLNFSNTFTGSGTVYKFTWQVSNETNLGFDTAVKQNNGSFLNPRHFSKSN